MGFSGSECCLYGQVNVEPPFTDSPLYERLVGLCEMAVQFEESEEIFRSCKPCNNEADGISNSAPPLRIRSRAIAAADQQQPMSPTRWTLHYIGIPEAAKSRHSTVYSVVDSTIEEGTPVRLLSAMGFKTAKALKRKGYLFCRTSRLFVQVYRLYTSVLEGDGQQELLVDAAWIVEAKIRVTQADSLADSENELLQFTRYFQDLAPLVKLEAKAFR